MEVFKKEQAELLFQNKLASQKREGLMNLKIYQE